MRARGAGRGAASAGSVSSGASQALRVLRRRTLGRSLRSNLRWLFRSVGWGSVVYLIGWSVVLLVAAVQSLTPLPAPQRTLVEAWAGPLGMALLALTLIRAAGTRITPVWLDRRELAHLVTAPVPAAALLAWPWWRSALPAATWGLALGGVVAVSAWRLAGAAPLNAVAALPLLPSLSVALVALRGRAALAAGRDALAWALAALGVGAAALALAAASLSWSALGQLASAPLTALLAPHVTTLATGVAWGTAVLVTLATLALTLAQRRRLRAAVPGVLLRQSEVLAELRAVRLLRALAAVQALPPDPGARFAAARARSTLLARRPAPGPGWRPRVPRTGAVGAFVWLLAVRTWRRSPWSLLLAPLALVTASVAMAPAGPFGTAALAPSLLAAWASASLHPGQVGWAGFAVDVRARSLALGLVVGVLAVLATLVTDLTRAAMSAPPALEGWLLLPLALAAATLVDVFARSASDPAGLDVWLLAGVLVATPAAVAGWAEVAPGVAAPLLGMLWLGVAWLRVVSMRRLG